MLKSKEIIRIHNIKLAKKDYLKCIELCNKYGLQDRHEYIQATENLSECNYKLGEFAECIENLKHLAKINHNDNKIGWFNAIALCYRNLKDQEGEEEYLIKVIKLIEKGEQ